MSALVQLAYVLLTLWSHQPPPQADRAAAAQSYAALAETSYAAALQKAEALRTTVDAFCRAPSPELLQQARTAWVAARAVYGRTEVFRFGNGPIDAKRGGVEQFINAWPLDEAYIEPADPAVRTGLIRDRARYPLLNRALLHELNQKGGETNVCTGWHAIEFMLWGRDVSATGPGARSATDFAEASGADAERRREYLQEITALLCQDLAVVANAWKDAPGTYRAAFVADPQAAARSMLAGVALLASFEMAGERLSVAIETHDQEEEHSCFSDTTHVDFQANVRGIAAVLRGGANDAAGSTAGSSAGNSAGTPATPGLIALVRSADPAAAQAMENALTAAVRAVDDIPAPFDQAILAPEGSPQRAKLHAALQALEALGAATSAGAKALGYTLPTEPQG